MVDKGPAYFNPAAIDHRPASNKLVHALCELRIEDLQKGPGPLGHFLDLPVEHLSIQQIRPQTAFEKNMVADHQIVENR